MNKIKNLFIIGLILSSFVALASQAKYFLVDDETGDVTQLGEETLMLGGPVESYHKSLYPETDSKYYLGTTTKAWKQATSDSFFLIVDSCVSSWAAGSMTALATGNLYVGNGSNEASATSSIYITPTGDVGIGTTTPAYELDVYGDIRANGSFYGDGSNLTGIGIEYENTITVAKSGGDYTTIQGAINASVSGDTILIYDGTYTENVTTKTGAMTTLVGVGTMGSVIIESNSGTALTVPSAMMTIAFIKNLKLKSTATGNNSSKLFYGEGTMTTFNSVSFDYNISNGYTEEIIDLEAGSYVFTNCKFDYILLMITQVVLTLLEILMLP